MSPGVGRRAGALEVFRVVVERGDGVYRLSFLGVTIEAERLVGAPEGFRAPGAIWARSVTVMFSYTPEGVERAVLIG